MSKTRKKQIFKAMKFRIIKKAKFYSSEIKWVYRVHRAQLFVRNMTKTCQMSENLMTSCK